MRAHASLGLRVFRLVLALAAALAGTSPPAEGARARPNIIFIMSDDHCSQAIGAYGEFTPAKLFSQLDIFYFQSVNNNKVVAASAHFPEFNSLVHHGYRKSGILSPLTRSS